MIGGNGWMHFSTWEHSARLCDLYTRRVRGEEPEMTCAAQASELLAPYVMPGDTLLDVGCATGYFFHSLLTRGLAVDYYGIDASRRFIEIGRRELRAFGLPPQNLQPIRIDDLVAEIDHVVCMNVLSNLDNFHRPLERLLHAARKTVILRESAKDTAEYLYVRDDFLDEGVNLKVHVNAYATDELVSFMESYGFEVEPVLDVRSGGRPELVAGYPHHWTFFVARRTR